MDEDCNTLSWFEIPVKDMDRAKEFYETILEIKMQDLPEILEIKKVAFPANGRVCGVLAKSPMHKPSLDGSLIYLSANPAIQPVIDRIEKAGGKILLPKTEMGSELGFMAYMIDTEGNAVALHAQN
jgi:predicted enzyme related to lactoylglutathione lyase